MANKRIDFKLTEQYETRDCSKCGAPMFLIPTAKGKKLPLSVATKETRDGVDYYESHWYDCPAADQFRKDSDRR